MHALAPFLMAEANGTLVNLALFMLPVTSWSCFSLLCPSDGSVWILVKYGHSKQVSGAMSCLALYVQTIMRILKSFLSKEMRQNRFTKEISGENECEVFPAELSSSQLREVTEESSKARTQSQKTWLSNLTQLFSLVLKWWGIKAPVLDGGALPLMEARGPYWGLQLFICGFLNSHRLNHAITAACSTSRMVLKMRSSSHPQPAWPS